MMHLDALKNGLMWVTRNSKGIEMTARFLKKPRTTLDFCSTMQKTKSL